MKIFECVPNVSEGRDRTVLDACARAVAATGVTLAHETSDGVHHRAVLTFFGTRETVLDASVALARAAASAIDLRTHRGAHPRMGALDVLPFVPFGDATEADAVDVAHEAARRIWAELRIPSFFYGAAGRERLLADVRRGGFEALAARAGTFDTGDLAHPSAGAIAIGVRAPLVAFNVVLASDDLALARRIARTIRERDGGLRTLRALGIALGDGRVQVSCNLTDPAATPLWLVTALVRLLAEREGVGITETELVGLVPRAALEAVVAHAFGIDELPRAPSAPPEV
jgi:glutamate formiminotransferase